MNHIPVKCYCCNDTINNKNRSNEHIIPEGIGGIISSRDILCKKCNEDFGKTIDASLVNSLRPILVKLGIGNVDNFNATTSLTQSPLRIHMDGSSSVLTLQVKLEDDKINISAPTKDRLYHEIRKTLKERNLPLSIADEVIKNAQQVAKPLVEKYEFDFLLSDDIFRAIGKIALNYYLYLGNRMEDMGSNELLKFIKGEEQNNVVALCYLIEDTSGYRNDNEIFNIISLKGEPGSNILYAYVDILHMFRFIVLMSESYHRQKIESCHVVNPQTKTVANAVLHVDLRHKDILFLLKNNPIPDNNLSKKIMRELKNCFVN